MWNVQWAFNRIGDTLNAVQLDGKTPGFHSAIKGEFRKCHDYSHFERCCCKIFFSILKRSFKIKN